MGRAYIFSRPETRKIVRILLFSVYFGKKNLFVLFFCMMPCVTNRFMICVSLTLVDYMFKGEVCNVCV